MGWIANGVKERMHIVQKGGLLETTRYFSVKSSIQSIMMSLNLLCKFDLDFEEVKSKKYYTMTTHIFYDSQ